MRQHRVSSDQPQAHSEAGSTPYRLLPPSGGSGRGVHLEAAKISLCHTRVKLNFILQQTKLHST